MNKKLLERLAQTKDRFNDIMSLRKSGKQDPSKYDEIFQNYGQLAYNIAVPSKHRKAEIKQLMKEGRFEDIYRKHGNRAYKEHIYEMQAIDVYNETGSKPKSIINRIKNVIGRRIAPLFLSTLLIAPPTTGAVIDFSNTHEKEQNKLIYSEQLERYDERISAYANEVNTMNLTDTQIFMKVMSDMWSEIDGYGENTKDISGLLRLSLQEDGQGVCRHFADDVTAKLNAINPEYNARNLAVYMADNQYMLANIDRTILQSNNTVAGAEQGEAENSDFINAVINVVGNHVVTVVDVPGQNVSLVLDPTNPGIGVFKDGEIHMFSTPDGKGISPKVVGQFLANGGEEVLDLGITTFKSFLPAEKSLEELESIYGTEAQNDALEYLVTLEQEKAEEAMKSGYSFDDKIKVSDTDILHRIEDVSKTAAEKQSVQIETQENVQETER